MPHPHHPPQIIDLRVQHQKLIKKCVSTTHYFTISNYKIIAPYLMSYFKGVRIEKRKKEVCPASIRLSNDFNMCKFIVEVTISK